MRKRGSRRAKSAGVGTNDASNIPTSWTASVRARAGEAPKLRASGARE
jgi:hypothetical protein